MTMKPNKHNWRLSGFVCFCNYKRNDETEFRKVVFTNLTLLEINIIIHRAGLVFVCTDD